MDDETGNGHAEDFREDTLGDLGDAHPGGGRPGLGESIDGLSAFERGAISRVARERSVEDGREQFGRYASAHPRDIRERGSRGLSDDDALDALFDTAQRFDTERDAVSQRERDEVAEVISADRLKSAYKSKPDPEVALFTATVPNGGVKTDRNNNWILTLEVAWEDRNEIVRVIETIPMRIGVKITKLED